MLASVDRTEKITKCEVTRDADDTAISKIKAKDAIAESPGFYSSRLQVPKVSECHSMQQGWRRRQRASAPRTATSGSDTRDRRTSEEPKQECREREGMRKNGQRIRE